MFKRISTGTKWIIASLFIEGLMLSLLISNNLSHLSQTLQEQTQHRLTENALFLQSALSAPLIQMDYATVEAIMKETQALEGIEYLIIKDTADQVILNVGWSEKLPIPTAEKEPFSASALADARFDHLIPLSLFGSPLGSLLIGHSTRFYIDAYHEAFTRSILIALLELSLSAFLLLLINHWLRRQFSRITQQAHAIANGDYKQRLVVDDRQYDELGQTFNQMAETIEQRILALQHANEVKSQFLATMSHELRTPLNAILGFSQLLTSDDLSSAQHENLQHIQTAGSHLLSLINQMIDVNQLEFGKIHLEQSVFHINSLVEQLTQTIQPLAEQKALTFTITLHPDVPEQLVGDFIRLQQVLTHLLTNAIKFTRQGKITLEIQPTDEQHYRFSITDTGIGIAPEKQRLLFQAFSQVNEGHKRSFDGAGIGLRLSQLLVQAMQGQIHVESEQDKGSRFWFELPIQRPSHEQQTTSEHSTITTAAIEAVSLADLSVLLVEDNKINQLVAQKLLAKLNIKTIDIANNGQEALEKLTERHYDCVLLDIQMPIMDGFETITHIRHQELTNKQHQVVIAISANTLTSDREKALLLGMDEYLTKPIHFNQLTDTLQHFFHEKLAESSKADQ